MVDEFQVYCAFRRAQSKSKNRGFRIPKNWDDHFSKMSKPNQDALKLASQYFSTTWRNIDIDKFMDCGFKIFKGFTYHQFFNRKVINKYIEEDKSTKRRIKKSTDEIDNSIVFIKDFMKDKNALAGYNKFETYCKLTRGEEKIPVLHYVKGFIDNNIIVFMISHKYLRLSEDDKAKMPYIVNNFREIAFHVEDNLIDYIKESINNV